MSVFLAGCQYIPSVEYFVHWIHSGQLLIEGYEHYQKKSWRNKTAIIGSDTPLSLSVPLRKGKNQAKPIRDVEIAYDEPWHKIHLHSIQTAYGKTAFFEEVETSLIEIYNAKPSKLWDLNMILLEALKSFLRGNYQYTITGEFIPVYPLNYNDYRKGLGAGISDLVFEKIPGYHQVQRIGKPFLGNLSILDVLCHLGPDTDAYLDQYAIQLYPTLS
ncbi:MAG: WbqC family protein [Bacteroidota bacterium]|nr:WbqC family protein [Bacteroidota bacterium]